MSIRSLHLLESASTAPGSVTVCARGLAEYLKGEGHDVTVEHLDCATRPISSKELSGFDLLHLHGLGLENTLAISRMALRAKTPFVISPAGELDPARLRRLPRRTRWQAKLYAQKSIRGAVAVLAQSDNEVEVIRQRCRRDVTPLSYGIGADWDQVGSDESAENSVVTPDGRCLLMLAPIEPTSGCAALLKAFAEVGSASDGWYVAIVGEDRGDTRKMLQAAIRRKGGEDRVVFSNAATPSEQAAWIRRAECLVAASPELTTPTAALQAASLGRGVAGTDAGVPQSLRDDSLQCSASRGGIRECLRKLLSMNDIDRSTYGKKAETIVKEQLHWGVIGKEYVRLYESLKR